MLTKKNKFLVFKIGYNLKIKNIITFMFDDYTLFFISLSSVKDICICILILKYLDLEIEIYTTSNIIVFSLCEQVLFGTNY